MRNRKNNETDVLAAQLSEMEGQAMTEMIDMSTLNVEQVQEETEEVPEQHNPLIGPIKASSKYVTEATIAKMPIWEPPTLQKVLQFTTLEHLTHVLGASYILHDDMGSTHHGSHPVKSRDTPRKEQLIFDLVTAVFEAEHFTIEQLKMQQQMFKAADLIQTKYEHIPVYLYSEMDSFLAIPPFDIRPRLLMLLTLSFCQVDLSEATCAFFLNMRMCDLVESIFWLTHTVVFLGGYGRTTVSELLMEKEIKTRPYNGKYQIPEHLNLVQENFTLVDYLTNKCADDYAVIQRCWMGARSQEKNVIQEYLPYFVANSVYRGFLRTFPQYTHVFSSKFLDTLYNNVIYMCSGVLNYPDFQQEITESIFGDSVIATAHAFVQYISGGSALMGEENSDEIDLRCAMFGMYDLECNELPENMRKTSQFYKSDETNQNELDEGAITYGAVIKPIDFDFVLFEDLVLKNEKYSVYRSATRNIQGDNGKKVNICIDQSLLFQSNETISESIFSQLPSLSETMHKESLRVIRHAIPRTTLESISNITRPMSPMRSVEKVQHEKGHYSRSHAGIFELDPIDEPKTKYVHFEAEDVAQPRKPRKKATNYAEMVEEDIDSYMAPEVCADGMVEDLKVSELGDSASETLQKTQSVTVDDTFIIRLPERLRPFKPPETSVSELIASEVVTNNDVVFRLNDSDYQKVIDDSIKGVKQLYAQKLRSKSPQKREVSPAETTGGYADAIEIMRGHPLRISGQTLSVTTTSPLLIRYLEISGAPAPADFKNVIIEDECRPDPNLGRSDFYARKQAHAAGQDAHASSMIGTSIREVNVVRRTRNDPWIQVVAAKDEQNALDDGGVGENNIQTDQTGHMGTLSGRLSPNRFHIEYQERKTEIQKLRCQDRENQRQALADLEVSKTLFLDPNLKGRQTRTAALSKAIVQEVDGAATRGGDVEKGTKSEMFLHEMREDLKKKMKSVDCTERIARQNEIMENKRKEKKAQQNK